MSIKNVASSSYPDKKLNFRVCCRKGKDHEQSRQEISAVCLCHFQLTSPISSARMPPCTEVGRRPVDERVMVLWNTREPPSTRVSQNGGRPSSRGDTGGKGGGEEKDGGEGFLVPCCSALLFHPPFRSSAEVIFSRVYPLI